MPLGLEKVALMAASGGAEETYVPTKDHTVGGYSDSGYNFVNTVFTASSNSWATATAYSEAGWTGFFDHTLIVDGQNGISYQLGGRKRESSSNANTGTSKKYVFDTDTWSSITAAAAKPRLQTNAIIEDKIYMCSGWQGNTEILNTAVYEYDIAGNSYSEKASMTSARGGANNFGTQIGGKAYTIGGVSTTGSDASQSIVEEYTQSTNTWASKTSITNYFIWGGGNAVGEQLFCHGGRNNSGGQFDTTYRYTQATDTWATRTAFSTAVQNCWSYAVNNSGTTYSYVHGGSYTGSDNSTTNWYYSDAADSYTSQSAMTTGRRLDP